MFNPNPLYLTDGYKPGHKAMLAPGTTKLYGTWIPRSLRWAPQGITKITSFGHQLTWRYLHDIFEEYFFFKNDIEDELDNMRYNSMEREEVLPSIQNRYKTKALKFIKDMSLYLGMEYNGNHFSQLWDLGYLPIKVKALPEGIETDPNIPHMTFVNTVDGFAWLTLYLETVVSSLAWKPATAATIAKLYRRQAEEWVAKTDSKNLWLVDYMCHDFSARGLSGPYDMMAVGLGHATSFRGSDTLAAIPAARYYYNESENEVIINSVNASEHSVSCTELFYYEDKLKQGLLNNKIKEFYSFDLPADGSVDNPDYLTIAEWLMLDDWLDRFPKGILSVVDDTMNTWKHITQVIARLKDKILARDGKLVTRPDSGDPVDIICGRYQNKAAERLAGMADTSTFEAYQKAFDGQGEFKTEAEFKGVIELLWDIFGGTINEQGYKVLDPHIGAIYGDSITPDRQREIYQRLAAKGFAATIVLGVGSFTYQYNTRDTLGFAAKGAWFEVADCACTQRGEKTSEGCSDRNRCKKSYNIYKDPVTDDGTKKSLKGLLCVYEEPEHFNKISVKTECTPEEENQGLLQVIYEDGKFYNTTTFKQIRERLNDKK